MDQRGFLVVELPQSRLVVRVSHALESPLFIVGAPRSGTTLLRDLLRSHPRLTFPQESHFITRAWDIWGEVRGPADAALLGRFLLRHPSIKRWSLPDDDIPFERVPTFAGVVAAIYEAYARTEGKARWGDKTPQYVLRLPLLGTLFKEARFIHIIRDGRDVARSWMKHPYGAANAIEAASFWRTCVEAGRTDGSALGAGRYREVRYEAVLDQPEATLKDLLSWAGEEYSPRVLTRSFLDPVTWAKNLPGGGVVRGNKDKWRTAMTPRERQAFEGLAGDVLESLGYETEGQGRRPGPLARLAGEVQTRASWVARRINPDPRRQAHLWPPFLWTLAFKWAALRRPRG